MRNHGLGPAKKAAQSQGAASSPVATSTTVGSPHVTDGGARRTVRVTATVEGCTTVETVTLLATPAGGSEDALREKQRKRKNGRLFYGARKRLTNQAYEVYLMPKHDVVPDHFLWPVGGRKDCLAQLRRDLSGGAVVKEEAAPPAMPVGAVVKEEEGPPEWPVGAVVKEELLEFAT